MQFITLQFLLFFLAIFVFAIAVKENRKYYPAFLLGASLVFYQFFGVQFFLILVANIVVNYLFLTKIQTYGRKFLGFAIVANVLFLGAFKYYNFGIDSFLQLMNLLQMPADVRVLRILIPVGVSFYTFRNISHLVDCYRRELAVPRFIDYANYVAFFPQIMSGPIVRAKDFYEYLHNPSLFSYSHGRIITLILSGLLKKYVVASFLYDAASSPFTSPLNYSSLDLVTGMLAYTAMIFVDFSGYSDLAIALSNLLGFHVHRNFNSPYRAIGLKDFWNRWHISLSAWLRDYVYIPLGGSRRGTTRKYVNIVITMFVSGLWHGAGPTFIVWGLLHGIGSVVSHIASDFGVQKSAKEPLSVVPRDEEHIDFFAQSTNKNAGGLFVDLTEEELSNEIEKLFATIDAPPAPEPETIGAKLKKIAGWLATFVYVSLAWIFFTAPSLTNALAFILSMFTSQVTEHKIFSLRVMLVVAVVVAFNFAGNGAFRASIRFFDKLPVLIRIPVTAAFIYVILKLGPETMPPFIYFGF